MSQDENMDASMIDVCEKESASLLAMVSFAKDDAKNGNVKSSPGFKERMVKRKESVKNKVF